MKTFIQLANLVAASSAFMAHHKKLYQTWQPMFWLIILSLLIALIPAFLLFRVARRSGISTWKRIFVATLAVPAFIIVGNVCRVISEEALIHYYVAKGGDGDTPATSHATTQTLRAGPLAAMPSAPGLHIDRIKAMDNDSWLDLGKPAPDPRWGMGYGRSYQPNLAWAPDLKCAFILGTGVHGATHKYPDGITRWENDVWAYDLWDHRWICLYPGIDISMGAYKVDVQGGATTDDGRGSLEGSHAYQHSCYDPT